MTLPDMTPPEPKRLYQRIGRTLKEQIDKGDYRIGERLPAERLIAEELDVSRTVVREAIIMLELEGRVEVRKGSGIYIVEPPHRNAHNGQIDELVAGPFEMLQARQLIESNIAEFAATQVTRNDIVELMRIVECGRSEDRYRDSDWDRQFHVQIAQATQNAVLPFLVEQMWRQRTLNPMWHKLHDRIENHDVLKSWCDDHEAILNALIRRSPQEAKRTMWQHLENTKQMLFEASTVDDDNDIDRFLFIDNPVVDIEASKR
ncbi:FCD domain-containing protein [Phytohalomonas tamaricis]|uniref:FCD domain-containing protein n=1 Tax=Phytohalomonas tamaricis TaxID=2081032 RepID=UPI0021D47DB6|nr:FCD domain-containing protein [Phytohalomonas tamaricis]